MVAPFVTRSTTPSSVQLGLDKVEGPYNDLLSPSYRPPYFARELGQISFMWGRGGSETLPRERHENGLKDLPGMH
jgi:hypothetical protein